MILRDEPVAAGAAASNGHAEGGGAEEAGAGGEAAGGSTPLSFEQSRVTFLYQQDAPSCHECGAIMVRNGSCYKCLNCGSTSGCS